MSIQQQAIEILANSRIGVMATVENGRPYSRYMTFSHDGLTLYTVTANDAEKLAALEKNPHTHILYGYEDGDEGLFDAFLEIEGTVRVFSADAIKDRIVAEFGMTTVEGMQMVLLKIEPTRMRLMNKAGDNQQEVPL